MKRNKLFLVFGVLLIGCGNDIQIPETITVTGTLSAESPVVKPVTSAPEAEAEEEETQTVLSPLICNDINARSIQSYQSSIPNSTYDISKTLDCLHNTFFTTYTLFWGHIAYLTYQFVLYDDLTRIEYMSQPSSLDLEIPSIGQVDILVSTNSTNGFNGTWRNATILSKRYSPFSQRGQITIQSESLVRWVTFKMTYYNFGAYGETPSFYVNEIQFFK